MINKDDWRIRTQEQYLTDVILVRKKYADRITGTDHDHCEFCWAKFSDTIIDSLHEGYTTTDDYHWICDECYNDFKEDFRW